MAKYLDEITELASPNKLYCTHWPPEYFISNQMGRQADIYQAGITMYRLVIINRCIEIDVDKRYDTVLDIINDISKIDGRLDWQYQRLSVDKEMWTNIERNMEICISLNQMGDTLNMQTSKTNLESKKVSKVSNMCQNNISKEDAYKAVEEFTK